MIKLTGITLQGQGAPIQSWEVFVNPDQIQTIERDSGKTKIILAGPSILHVSEKPIDIIRLIYKSKTMFSSKRSSGELPPVP